jgi:hypothetical protein
MDFLKLTERKIPNAPLYFYMVNECVQDYNMHEDALQEAAIAVWCKQEEDKRAGVVHNDPGMWYSGVARWRIKNINSRQDFLEPEIKDCGHLMQKGKVCTRAESHTGDHRASTSAEKRGHKKPNGSSKDPLKQPHDSYDQKFLGWQQDD